MLGIALALGLMVLVTFVAFNWVYLSTVLKLGLIFALIVAAVIVWIWRGFDSRYALAAGLVAQIGIGLWLAAAGQLYQAPGGVQMLLIYWIILGLPFAIASRSEVHWALMFGLIFIACVSPPADFMSRAPSDEPLRLQAMIGTLIIGAAMFISTRGNASEWFMAWLALGSGVLAVLVVISGLASKPTFDVLTALALLANFALIASAYYRRKALAGLSLLTVSLAASIGALLLYLGADFGGFEVAMMAYSVLVIGGLTTALYRLFSHYLVRYGRQIETLNVVTAEGSARPWYMDGSVAAGGIVTALFGTAFLASFLGLILSVSEQIEVGLILIGALLYGGSLFLRLRTTALFGQYFLGTLMIIGGASLIGGFGVMTASVTSAALLTLLLSSLTLWWVGDAILQTVLGAASAVSIAALIVALKIHKSIPFDIIMLIFAGALALFWLLQNQRGRFVVFVVIWVTLIGFSLAFSMGGEGREVGLSALMNEADRAWMFAELRLVLGIGILCGLKKFRFETLPEVLPIIGLSVLGALMPAGGLAVIILLSLSVAIGSRVLASIALISFGVWGFWTYFNINLSLLELSLAFGISAIGAAGLYWRLRQTKEVAV